MSQIQLILLIILLLLAGFFAGITVAFIRINKLKIEIQKKQGKVAGRILSKFGEQPGRFITTSVAGFTITLVIFGILAAEIIKDFWKISILNGIPSPYLQMLAGIFASTFIMLIFGLLIPRSLFRAKADHLLVIFALPISFFSRILHPVNNVMSGISRWVLKYLFNVRITSESQDFQLNDPENFIIRSETGEAGHQHLNTELFENALSLPHVKVRGCMVPRKEIESLEVNTDIQEVVNKFLQTNLSKLIIYEDNIDNISGYIHQLDLFKGPADIRSIIYPILAIPETMSAVDLLSRFTKENKSIAWVVDEFGGTAGIVTLEDVLEEIFGDIRDEHDTEEFVEKQIAEKEYIFSGRLEIDYLNEKYG
ncbi:MAG: hemolysin family protein, partial [Chitinophagaceae bacterium]